MPVTSEDVKGRVAQIKRAIDDTDSDWDREKLQERLAKLAGGVAVVKVGAATEVELKEKKHRIEDALSATRAAVEEGIVAGGGTALSGPASRSTSWRTRSRATRPRGRASWPTRSRSRCAGSPSTPGSRVRCSCRQVESAKGNIGLNAATGEIEDLVKAGIIDPAKVTRSALQNAASIAGAPAHHRGAGGRQAREGRRRRRRRRRGWWNGRDGWHGRNDVTPRVERGVWLRDLGIQPGNGRVGCCGRVLRPGCGAFRGQAAGQVGTLRGVAPVREDLVAQVEKLVVLGIPLPKVLPGQVRELRLGVGPLVRFEGVGGQLRATRRRARRPVGRRPKTRGARPKDVVHSSPEVVRIPEPVPVRRLHMVNGMHRRFAVALFRSAGGQRHGQRLW